MTLDSVPSGADLFINGTIGGSTPATLKVEEGVLEIQLVLEGYETREFSITKDTQEQMVIRCASRGGTCCEETGSAAKPKPSTASKKSPSLIASRTESCIEKTCTSSKGGAEEKG